MAGGKGSRLLPYSAPLFPKPLMPLGDKPVLEILLRQLRDVGVTESNPRGEPFTSPPGSVLRRWESALAYLLLTA